MICRTTSTKHSCAVGRASPGTAHCRCCRARIRALAARARADHCHRHRCGSACTRCCWRCSRRAMICPICAHEIPIIPSGSRRGRDGRRRALLGDPVAAVVADTRAAALDAAELVDVTYRVSAAVITAAAAVTRWRAFAVPGPWLEPALAGTSTKTDDAFAQSAAATFDGARRDRASRLSPRRWKATHRSSHRPDTGGLHVYVSTQWRTVHAADGRSSGSARANRVPGAGASAAVWRASLGGIREHNRNRPRGGPAVVQRPVRTSNRATDNSSRCRAVDVQIDSESRRHERRPRRTTPRRRPVRLRAYPSPARSSTQARPMMMSDRAYPHRPRPHFGRERRDQLATYRCLSRAPGRKSVNGSRTVMDRVAHALDLDRLTVALRQLLAGDELRRSRSRGALRRSRLHQLNETRSRNKRLPTLARRTTAPSASGDECARIAWASVFDSSAWLDVPTRPTFESPPTVMHGRAQQFFRRPTSRRRDRPHASATSSPGARTACAGSKVTRCSGLAGEARVPAPSRSAATRLASRDLMRRTVNRNERRTCSKRRR